MVELLKRLWKLFSREEIEPLSEDSAKELSTAFKARYQSFKLLLAANNKTLELMAELEGALRGGRLFGMSFVKSHCTALGVNVFQMVRNLDNLAPDGGKYVALYSRLQAIQKQIQDKLAQKQKASGDIRLVIPLNQIDREGADVAGGKMANLGEVKNRLKMPVPSGFVITAAAYRYFFKHNAFQEEINRLIQAAVLERVDHLFRLSSQIQQRVVRGEVPPELAREIEQAYGRLQGRAGKKNTTVSLRSSALGEDAADASFAGQYRSQLNVRPENLLDAYKDVVASKYTPQAMHYRLMRGLRDEDMPMCVGCLAMVDARAGGVAYSCNALDIHDDRVHVTAAWGLAKSVVDGHATADLFVVDKSDPPKIVKRQVAHKESKYNCYPLEGVCRLDLTGDEADQPSLDDGEILRLAEMVRDLEAHYGSPQDVEWAVDQSGDLIILQSRPLRQLPADTSKGSLRAEGAQAAVSGGIGASPGTACGPVFRVQKDSDALRFPEGAVLVLTQPLPRWASLLGRAAAVVAEQGSQAGHLATVAREYGIPALMGMGPETKILQNDELVTVDAEGGAIYRGRVESLLRHTEHKHNFMAGSPIYQTLEDVTKHIIPLTLLDPDSPRFAAENCRTFHDITRFCHEKSVMEMFDFGKAHHYPQRSSKQLYHEVPMQYWVINLDDGFHEEVDGKYVKLENIACPAMLALWEGIVAVPWDGPPGISGKGFVSVMFEATANPALATPFKTSYANRNYFMISRDFMNLQSRFGFHLTAVEALVTERTQVNYISFSFKGGAADQDRKYLRVRFIADLLEEPGFRVEVKEDTAFARLEGLGRDDMFARLRVIGYLLMHTRQLDMIMASPAAVQHYRDKMNRDIKTLMEQSSGETS